MKNNMLVFVSFMLLFAILVSAGDMKKKDEVQKINFSTFISLVTRDQVKDVTFKTNGTISGSLNTNSKFETFGDIANPRVYSVMEEHKLTPNYEKDEPSILPQILLAVLPMIFLIGVLYMFAKMMSPNKLGSSFTKTAGKMIVSTGITFQDVAGNEEAKEDLKDIIDFLSNPYRYIQIGSRMPKGVLLSGGPGLGKTLLAKAVAGEAKVPFFSVSGSEFVEMFVGVGASRVRELFEQAKKHAPCIVFIDEIDAVGRARSGFEGGNSEREQTLNQLLVEMDGFHTNSGVVVMAATNRADILDHALLRPGRFDRKVYVSNPDVKAREAILNVHTKKVQLDRNVDLKTIARGTVGFSGADLENLVNEATIIAAKSHHLLVTMHHMEHAKDKVLMGSERKHMVMSELDKSIIAYHEAGHTLVNKMISGLDPIHKVSIIPRGLALGVTVTLPEEDQLNLTKTKAEGNLAFLMGGRAAEEIIFNHYTTGASNDIERATQLARKMITEWGMSSLGPIKFDKNDNLSSHAKYNIDVQVSTLIEVACRKAKDILTANIDALHNLANNLIELETLDSEQVSHIINLTTEIEGL